MKTLILPFLLSLSFTAQGQTPDTVAMRVEVDSLITLNRSLIKERKYDEAHQVIQQAEEKCLATFGEETALYGTVVFNKGRTFDFQGDIPNAEKYYLQSKLIREKTIGMNHPDFAWSLNNLGYLYYQVGNYEKAEPFYLKAKSIREKTLGKEHPKYAAILNNLGILYQVMGNYEKAEPLYLEAKSIRENFWGKQHPNYASSLNNLGILYKNMGNYEKAEPLYLEAKLIREKNLGMEDPDYAGVLINLGVLYWKMGNYEKAETLYLEAKSIEEKKFGKEHPDYAGSLINLGVLYWEMGDYGKAEPLLVEVKMIFELKLKLLEHPFYLNCLEALGVLYYKMGDYEKGEPLLVEVLAIREKTLGKEHPEYAGSRTNLGILYWNMGKTGKAKPIFLESNEIEKSLLLKASRHLSEKELLSYIDKFKGRQNLFLSFAKTQSGLSEGAYDNTLFYKGFLLNAAQQMNRLALVDSLSREMFYSLKAYNRRLAKAYSKPLIERDSSTITDLEEKANNLEKELTRSVAGFGEALRQVNWQELQAILKTGEAAIEFVHYQYSDPEPTDSTMYAALVLRPGDEQPQFIPLFKEKQLQQLVSGKNQAENISLAYGSRGLKPGNANNLQGLYELSWQAMEKHLKGVKKVYYAPSGLLHRINFNAIPINKQDNLSDRFQLVRLSSTRSLVVPDLTKTDADNAAILYGGIHYELDTMSLAQDSIVSDLLATRSGGLSFTYSDRSLPQRGDNWDYLKGTQQEVTEIESLLTKSNFSAHLFSGKNATEEAFKTIGKNKPSPRILHLATHGYFFPDISRRSFSEGGSPALKQEPVFKISDHPMIRSGLILAGGNHAWKTGKPLRPDMEDGILTAYEISQMDLSSTELVVLSACETGLGDIEGNEGVYGLQRAFKIAGAKYLIMSLWQVPDHQTQELMTTFYSKWLTEKMSIPDAFRQSQKEMQKKHGDPYLWAGFVLVE